MSEQSALQQTYHSEIEPLLRKAVELAEQHGYEALLAFRLHDPVRNEDVYFAKGDPDLQHVEVAES